MFRGGPVSSYGTGIATGLGYNNGGRVGYAKAGEVKSYEDTIKDEERKQEILSKGFKTEEDFRKEYENKIESSDPLMLLGIDEFGPGTFGEKATENFEILSSDAAKNAYVSEKLAEQNKVVEEAEGLGVSQDDLPKTEKKAETGETSTGTGTGTGGDGTGLNNFQEKSDKQVMQEYMDMFKESLGADKDELNRQRFLEIAKFGANLLAQPGGQSLGEAVGKAGAPALEGFSKIEAAERAGDIQAKTLGFQAALKELQPGQIGRNIRDLKKAGYSDAEAKKIATNTGEATNKRTLQTIIEGYATDIQQSPGAPESAVIIKGLAETIAKSGNDLSDFAPLTEAETIIKDKFYYDKQGKIYKGKEDGTYVEVTLG
jgi:hypothetical protein